MSAEAFDTVFSADMRTAPDGRGIELAPSGTGQPRWVDVRWNGSGEDSSRAWASCYGNAELLIKTAADAVAEQEMDGLTGDHPAERAHLAEVLRACATAVRELALDHTCDGALMPGDYERALDAIRATLDAPIGD